MDNDMRNKMKKEELLKIVVEALMKSVLKIF
ncbi:iojap superfamily protein [Streptococcus pyogenes]|nr:iojap superfamily protein [Streptococcus pyogenes]